MIPINQIETIITEDNQVVIGVPSFFDFFPVLVFGNIDLYDKFVQRQNELLQAYRLQRPPEIPSAFLRAFEGG